MPEFYQGRVKIELELSRHEVPTLLLFVDMLNVYLDDRFPTRSDNDIVEVGTIMSVIDWYFKGHPGLSKEDGQNILMYCGEIAVSVKEAVDNADI